VTDPLSAAEVRDFQDALDALVNRAAGTLVGLWQIYVSSFQGGRTGGARRAAASEGDPGTVAVHGFMNMPSRLAAAMTGSDGGDLDWLGSSGVHDVMHFQLKPGARPAL
jgi:hypothetical protein